MQCLKILFFAERAMFSEVVMLKRVLINTATNTIRERSFSAYRRSKIYHGSAMVQRL